jgi:hypothetical protein
MPNLPLQSEYERIVKNSERLFKQVNRANQAEYAALLKDVRMEVADVYAKYAKAGTLTYAEMQKYDRIKKLKTAIDDLVKSRFGEIKSQTTQGLTTNTKIAYAASAIAIGSIIARTPSERIDPEAASAIIQRPLNGLTYNEKMDLRKRELGERLKSAVVVGFIGAVTLQEISKSLKSVAEKDFIRTRSYVGDAMHRVSQEAAKESVIDATKKSELIPSKTWMTVGDAIVRPAHRKLDGQTVEINDYFIIPSGEWAGYKAQAPYGFNESALDNYCRCWLVFGMSTKDELTETN